MAQIPEKRDYLYGAQRSQPSSWRCVTFINTQQKEGGLKVLVSSSLCDLLWIY